MGTTLTEELNNAGRKRAKNEAANESARQRVLSRYLGKEGLATQGQFADPAAFFK